MHRAECLGQLWIPVHSGHMELAASGVEFSPELDGTARRLGGSGSRQMPGSGRPGSTPSRPCGLGQLPLPLWASVSSSAEWSGCEEWMKEPAAS